MDFDGSRALAAVETLPRDKKLNCEFLRGYCECVLTAVNLICDWVRNGPGKA